MTTIHWSGLIVSRAGNEAPRILTAEVVVLVVENPLDGYNICGVGAVGAYGGHDCRQDVFLDRERSWVERVAKNLDVRDSTSPEATQRENQQLGDDSGDCNGGVTEEEELVQAL